MPMNDQPFLDDGANGHPRIERAERILKHDLQLSAQRLAAAAPGVSQVLAVEEDAAAGRFDQPQQGAAGGGFAAARLADQAERFAFVDVGTRRRRPL